MFNAAPSSPAHPTKPTESQHCPVSLQLYLNALRCPEGPARIPYYVNRLVLSWAVNAPVGTAPTCSYCPAPPAPCAIEATTLYMQWMQYYQSLSQMFELESRSFGFLPPVPVPPPRIGGADSTTSAYSFAYWVRQITLWVATYAHEAILMMGTETDKELTLPEHCVVLYSKADSYADVPTPTTTLVSDWIEYYHKVEEWRVQNLDKYAPPAPLPPLAFLAGKPLLPVQPDDRLREEDVAAGSLHTIASSSSTSSEPPTPSALVSYALPFYMWVRAMCRWAMRISLDGILGNFGISTAAKRRRAKKAKREGAAGQSSSTPTLTPTLDPRSRDGHGHSLGLVPIFEIVNVPMMGLVGVPQSRSVPVLPTHSRPRSLSKRSSTASSSASSEPMSQTSKGSFKLYSPNGATYIHNPYGSTSTILEFTTAMAAAEGKGEDC